MKSFFVKTGIATLTALLLTLNISAQTYNDLLGQDEKVNTITTAVSFLTIAPDARSGALGDAGVASAPDGSSIHWNPAKLAFIEKDMGFSISYTPWLRALVDDINLSYLGFFKKIDEDQAIGASLLYFTLGEIQFTDDQGGSLGTVSPNEFALDFAYSRKLGEDFSGGIALRYVYSNLTAGQIAGGIETKPGWAIAADVSAYYQKDIDFNRTPAKFAAGINISNIGNKISYSESIESDFIPINLRFGPSLTFQLDDYNSLALLLDINKLLVPTPPIYKRDETSSGYVYDDDGNLVIESGKDPNRGVVSGIFGSFTDAPGGFSEEMKEFTISSGVEYWYDKQFALRGGYFYENELKGNRKFFTLGLGLKYNVFGLDFAYLVPIAQRNALENVLRFSLTFDLDAVREQ